MVCVGKADYEPIPGLEELWHVIGKGEAPILIIKKGKVQSLFTEEFREIYEIWKYHNAGFGLPDGKFYNDLDPFVSECIYNMEMYHRMNFSQGHVSNIYLESLLKSRAV